MSATNALFAPGRPARFDASQARRRSMLGKVHIACKQLNMDEDDYRQIVFDRTGRTSLTDASEQQIAAVLDVMKAKGFRPLPKKGKAPVAQHPMARKARALWMSLYHLNVVHNPAEQALEAFAARQLGCEKLVWARQSDAYRLIEALKDMARRAGWEVTGGTPIAAQESLCAAILKRLKRQGIAPGFWLLHDAAWRLCGIENAKADGTAWTADDYQRLAAALGDKLREHGGDRG